MSDSPLFSEHWYRVKDLIPRLANDVQISRHVYRQKVRYVLHRRSTGAYYRLDSHSFELVGKLDGTLRVGELWELALQLQDKDAPTQSDFIQLLAQLHEAELLVVNRRLNAEQLFYRGKQKTSKEFKQRYLNPLFLRFRLFDPDHTLSVITPPLQWIFTRAALLAWLILFLLAVAALMPNWAALAVEIAGFEYESPRYAALFLVVYPILKLLHEFAHGIAVKRFGGEVHELGMALMVLLPIPYVDASAAAAMPGKKHRMIIAAAGIFVELTVASLAVFIWLSSEGLLHDLALVVMLIGGISTLLFNGNPLLKFDGYYVLADAIEIPDLASKSKLYLQSLAGRILFFHNGDSVEFSDTRERCWLIGYGLLSTLYRLVLMLGIAYMLSGKFFFFGTILAIWIVCSMIVLPLWRFVGYLSTEPTVSRTRSYLVSGGALMAMLALLVYLPFPLVTVAEGVVWLPENAIVRVSHACNVTEQQAVEGKVVSAGDSLFTCEDTDLPSRIKLLSAELQELEAQQYGNQYSERVKRTLINDKIGTAQARLRSAEEKQAREIVRAQTSGRLVVAGNAALEGRFLAQGTIAAYVIPASERSVHVMIEQSEIHNIRSGINTVKMRIAGDVSGNQQYTTSMSQLQPRAGLAVASTALTTAGGGRLLADPAGDGLTVLEPVFHVELGWPHNAPETNVGNRVWVRFDHGAQPILYRMVTRFQRAFMRGLQV